MELNTGYPIREYRKAGTGNDQGNSLDETGVFSKSAGKLYNRLIICGKHTLEELAISPFSESQREIFGQLKIPLTSMDRVIATLPISEVSDTSGYLEHQKTRWFLLQSRGGFAGAIIPVSVKFHNEKYLCESDRIVLTGGACLFGKNRLLLQKEGIVLDASNPESREKAITTGHYACEVVDDEPTLYHRLLCNNFEQMYSSVKPISAVFHLPFTAYLCTLAAAGCDVETSRKKLEDHCQKIRALLPKSIERYVPNQATVVVCAMLSLLKKEEITKGTIARCLEQGEYVGLYIDVLFKDNVLEDVARGRKVSTRLINIDDVSEQGIFGSLSEVYKSIKSKRYSEVLNGITGETFNQLLGIASEVYGATLDNAALTRRYEEIQQLLTGVAATKKKVITGLHTLTPILQKENEETCPYLVI